MFVSDFLKPSLYNAERDYFDVATQLGAVSKNILYPHHVLQISAIVPMHLTLTLMQCPQESM